MEVLLLTEQWWGLPARSYTPTRGWTGADMDAGFDRLQARGLMTGEQLTDAGRAFREEIEVRTDELERPVLDALGDDLDELLDHLDAWSEAIIAAGSYPQADRRGLQHRRRPALRLRADHRHRSRGIPEQGMTVFTGPAGELIRAGSAGPYPVEAGLSAHEEHLGRPADRAARPVIFAAGAGVLRTSAGESLAAARW